MSFEISSFGTVIASRDPSGDAAFFVETFDYPAVAELEWYVSLNHPALPEHFLDFIDPDSDRCPLAFNPQAQTNVMLAMIVSDAKADAERLQAADG